ncbi:MAG TPA: hypothetical protein VGS20_05865 [Candidatus Acidoferrales bacterium]|nr:hypothetical protein [Candidatus Acidoferrales bacterium]
MWKPGAIAFALAALSVWGQSNPPAQQQKPAPSAPTHWGYYEPKPAPQPAQAPAKPAAEAKSTAPAAQTTSQGGDTSGNRPPIASTTSQSGGGAAGGGSNSQMVSVPDINGGSKSLVDQDTETVKLDDKTTRTTTRIYGQDADGNRRVIAIEQTDSTDLGGGKSKSVMTRTQRDTNGNFDLTKREVGETAPSGPNSSVTNITVFTPGVNGALAAVQQLQQVDRKGASQDQTTTTMKISDGNGGWTTGKITDTTVNKQAKDQQTQEEKVYTPDADGKLALSRRVVTRDWKTSSGQQRQQVDTYSAGPAGAIGATGGGLSLVQRVTTVKTAKPDGTVETREQTEARPVGLTSDTLRITGAVVEVDTPTKAGPMATQRTVFADDGNNHLQQISVFTGQQPAPAPAAPPEAKAAPAAKPPASKAPAAAPKNDQKKPGS